MSLFFRRRAATIGVFSLGLVACAADPGSGPDGDDPQLCSAPSAVALEPGQYRIIDASRESNCISLPSGASDREYLVVAYSGAATETSGGSSSGFSLQAGAGAAPAAAPAGLVDRADLPATAAFSRITPADFHRRLRLSERALSRDPGVRLLSSLNAPLLAQSIPVFGGKDSFSICRQLQCSSFNRIGVTVRYVGDFGVIYSDDDLPVGADALTQVDYDDLGRRFDDLIFPIDTTAFGRESDINLDQRIAIVVTDGVNDLTPTCSDGRIVGYFYGADLLPSIPGSNRREVFYTYAPKPATSGCPSVSRERALNSLPPVLIHELQHMISFNQHYLIRGGFDEDLWLNEGLSHFAEELGQRMIPNSECPGATSCFSQFASGNLGNAYDYLESPEATHLVAPGRAGGPLSERGAGWLFVRWLVDHYGTDSLIGQNITRGLVNTTRLGGANIAAVAGAPFATLVGEWQLANYLDNLPGVPAQGRLYYKTWNFRGTFAANSPAVFPKPFPLTPDSTTASYSHSGTLRAGSGRHVRFKVAAGATPVTVRLAASGSGNRLPDAIEGRIAVVRIH